MISRLWVASAVLREQNHWAARVAISEVAVPIPTCGVHRHALAISPGGALRLVKVHLMMSAVPLLGTQAAPSTIGNLQEDHLFVLSSSLPDTFKTLQPNPRTPSSPIQTMLFTCSNKLIGALASMLLCSSATNAAFIAPQPEQYDALCGPNAQPKVGAMCFSTNLDIAKHIVDTSQGLVIIEAADPHRESLPLPPSVKNVFTNADAMTDWVFLSLDLHCLVVKQASPCPLAPMACRLTSRRSSIVLIFSA